MEAETLDRVQKKPPQKKQGQIFKYFLGIYSQPHDHFLLHLIQV